MSPTDAVGRRPSAPERSVRAALARVRTAGRAVAFWLAIALPCLHLPMLATWGLTDTTTPLLGALWAGHALALVVGSSHDPVAD